MVHGQSTNIRALTEQYVSNGLGNSNAGVVNPSAYTNVFPAIRYRDNLSNQWLHIADISSVSVRSMMWPHRQFQGQFDQTVAPQVSGQSTNWWSFQDRIVGDASVN